MHRSSLTVPSGRVAAGAPEGQATREGQESQDPQPEPPRNALPRVQMPRAPEPGFWSTVQGCLLQGLWPRPLEGATREPLGPSS